MTDNKEKYHQTHQNHQNHSHSFLKEKVTNKECHICNNLWPSTDIIPKYNACSVCGLVVHTGCKGLSQCIPCNIDTIKQIDIERDSKFEITECNGVLKAHVLHAYDFTNINVGTSMYSNIKLLSVISEDVIQSNTAIIKDSGDVSWPLDKNCKGIPIKYPLKKSSQPVSYENESPVVYTPNTKLAKRASQKKYFSLNIQLWRNMMFVFDSLIASVTISIVPVILNPNVVTERWFALTNDAGEKCGMALLRIVFEPSDLTPPPKAELSPYMDKALTVLNSLEELVVKAAEPTPQINKSEDEPIVSLPTNPTLEKVTNFLSNLDSIVNQAAAPTPPVEPNPQSPITPITIPSPSTVEVVRVTTPVAKAKAPPIEVAVSTAESRKVFLENRTQSKSVEIKVLSKQPPPSPPHAVKLDNSKNLTREEAKTTKPTNAPKPVPNKLQIPIEKKVTAIQKSATTSSLTAPVSPGMLAGWANNVATSAWGLLYDVADVKKVSQPTKAIEKKTSYADIKKKKDTGGVGKMIIHLESVHKSAVSDAAEGDHFVTASFDDSLPGEEEKSHTVMSSATPVFNVKWTLNSTHYRSQLRLHLVDANNDRKVGIAKITPYFLMQREADKYGKPEVSPDMEKLTMYDANNEKEEIGYFKVSISFEEDVKNFFLSLTPKVASTSPDETLSIERLSRHIDRFKLLLNFFLKIFAEYRSIMNWDNIPLTIFLFALFVYTCLYIDAEYALCCPLFLCVFLMTRSLRNRRFGIYRKHWIEKGIPEEETYRPIACLRVAVVGFRNLPREWKVANLTHAKPCVKISYFPVQNDISATKMDKELVIGYVGGPNHGPSNDGTNSLSKFVSSLSGMIRNEHSKADLLQNTLDPWPADDNILAADEKNKVVLLCDDEKTHISCVYPILEPIVKDAIITEEADNDADKKAKKDYKQTPHLLPWEENDGIISFTIFQLNYLVDKAMGTVKIALKDLLAHDKNEAQGLQPEIAGWFTVSNDNNINSTSLEDIMDNTIFTKQSTDSFEGKDDTRDSSLSNQMQVYLRMQLDLQNTSPRAKEGQAFPTQKDKDLSQTLYSILCDKDNESKSGIAALWNMPENVVYVQNLMNWLLDIMESFKNIFDWTSPYKTLPIYVLIFLSWLAFVVVPGRYIILAIGVYQFIDRFIPRPEASAIMIIYNNLLTTIPNDDDLEQIYIKDRSAIIKAKQDLQNHTINSTKLELISSYIWRGKVSLKCAGVNSSQGELTPVYLVLQKNRLVWWDKERDLDDCKACVGQLLLFGHAGVTSAGPVDIKAIGDNTRITAVFGSDSSGSILKCTCVFDDSLACATFNNHLRSILKPSVDDDDGNEGTTNIKKRRGKMINTNNTLIGCNIN